ncbi:serine hydrolase domain-containing protein [Streptomyces pini]|uniref:CubicO group peptidase, beta-lactamase class C family n=1 Tax=Streptomyces pini TaxID=1520580 RepID=A0A1I4D331_9ACTN|nr:serine hydrolase domain-containing protein [Streptomyces pini]SFK86461.1 CubicO group peptidase, beta-lactamase class C family [Streptomyces pini]
MTGSARDRTPGPAPASGPDAGGGGAGGIGRRQLGLRALALGGGLVLASAPVAAARARGGRALAAGGHAPVLRRGSARRAGLLEPHLRHLVEDARAFLGPSPEHPWYAGAVLLAGRGGTVALHEAIGHAVRYSAYDEATGTGVELPAGEQVPATPETVYDLASVSKLFTAILAVRQMERGALELEGRVASYLPEFGAAGKDKITLLHLLTHTSGLAAWLPLYAEPTREDRLRRLWREEPLDPPGTVYRYSDLNLITLQLVLERVTGKGLDTLLREDVTEPLGMRWTRYNPPASWKPRIAATEDARRPWSGLDRGMVHGEVHDENAYAFGGVAGHAGVFSRAWDLAVLCRALLNGGAYGGARVLEPESVDLLFRDFNTAFPGDEHGLGFELYQHWFMGAMATPRTAGHTGFTGTCLVLDPTTDTFLVLLGNSVHPVRTWRSGSAPRVAAATCLARAVPVRPAEGRAAWFSGMASGASAVLALPEVTLGGSDGGGGAEDGAGGAGGATGARLSFSVWWDTERAFDVLRLEASGDGGGTWEPVPFTTSRPGQAPVRRPEGALHGFSGRVWHRALADLGAWSGRAVRLRWRYTTDARYVGRGAYVDGVRIEDGGRAVFDGSRRRDAGRVTADGWSLSAD